MKHRTSQRLLGSTVLDRLASVTLPAALKSPTTSFKQVHAELEAASKKTEDARAGRDEALATIAKADDVLDASVLALADAIVGAGLGARRNPFAAYSPHPPAGLVDLAWAREVKEVRALCTKLTTKKPAAEVKNRVATCAKNAAAVEAALKKLTGPQAAYEKSLAARDALLGSWTKSLSKLKKHAAAAWADDEASYAAVFAPVAAVQAGTKRVKRTPAPVVAPNGATL